MLTKSRANGLAGIPKFLIITMWMLPNRPMKAAANHTFIWNDKFRCCCYISQITFRCMLNAFCLTIPIYRVPERVVDTRLVLAWITAVYMGVRRTWQGQLYKGSSRWKWRHVC